MDARAPRNVGTALTGKDASLSTLMIVARELCSKGDLLKADELYSRVNNYSPLREADVKALAKLESQNTDSSSKLLEVLARRASVREKAGRLEEALQDANRMLKVVPKNPRGYFVLGGLLEKKKKVKSALKCYDYGISKCPQTHEAFNDLVKAAHDLRALISDNEANFIPEFPPEIISMIASYLTLNDILKCHRVSRQWHIILSSDPSLYTEKDLISSPRPLRTESVQALVRYSRGRITALRMRRPDVTFSPQCFRADDKAAFLNVKNVSNTHLKPLFEGLERLEITETSDTTLLQFADREKVHVLFLIPGFPSANLRHLDLEFLLSMAHVRRICTATPHLELFSFVFYERVSSPTDEEKGFASVKSLVIRTRHGGTYPFIYRLFMWFPSVEDFSYWPTMSLPPGDIQSMTDIVFENPNLKALRISPRGCQALDIRSENLRVLHISSAPTLRSLHFPVQRSLEELSLQSLPLLAPTCFFHCPVNFLGRLHESTATLRKLAIAFSPKVEVRDIDFFLREASGLEFVKLQSVKYVNDSTLELLAVCKQLQALWVDDCTGITGVGLIRLIKAIGVGVGGRLRTVSAMGNESIRRQTVDWARGMGVIITI